MFLFATFLHLRSAILLNRVGVNI